MVLEKTLENPFDSKEIKPVNPKEKLKKSESEVQLFATSWTNPMDCSPPGSSIHGIFQARVLEWAAISFSRGSSQPRDRTQVSCIADRHLTVDPPGNQCQIFIEGLVLKLNLQYFGHLMRRTDSLEKTLMLGKIEGRRRGQQRMR